MLILASTSATRKTLLEGAGLHFATHPARIDERVVEAGAKLSGPDSPAIAKTLALAKAMAVSAEYPEAVVIGADQVLALGQTLFHKPATLADAAAQLDTLAGRTHALHAGLALVRNGKELWSGVETAELTMRAFTPAERDEVLELEGQAVLASVGGYRLEGPSIRLFERIKGDYFTILGLPLLPLLAALRQHAPDCL